MTDLGFRMDLEEPPARSRALPWLVAGLVFLGIVAIGAVLIVRSFTDAGGPAAVAGPTATVEVSEGESVSQIAASLVKAGVISEAGPFIDAVAASDSSIPPGRYELKTQVSAAQAVALMLDPASRTGSRLVIAEGLRLREIIAAASDLTGIPPSEFRSALTRPEAVGLPAEAGGNPEGWLFPATYDVAPGATATSLLRQMTTRFSKTADSLNLTTRAKALGLQPEQVVTVASLLEAEVAPEDYGKAARVIYNRLANGTPLQLDSTVNFALGTDKIKLSARDLAVDSPYNTYLVTGLPPGPINSPGEAALEAALNPTAGPWKYFVTVDPKKRITKFAVTEKEFLELKRQFLQATS